MIQRLIVSSVRISWAAAALLLCITGCADHSSTEPLQHAVESSSKASNADADFLAAGSGFPLTEGSTWTYDDVVETVIEEDGEFGERMKFESTVESEIVGTEILFGREYIVRHEAWHSDEGTGDLWYRYREDLAGLYEADVFVNNPPTGSSKARTTVDRPDALHDARRRAFEQRVAHHPHRDAYLAAYDEVQNKLSIVPALRTGALTVQGRPGGVLEDELQRLKYPLRRGQSWDIRNSPHFGATVEAHDNVVTQGGRFSGVRIRYDSEFYGPEDDVVLWFGRDGLLKVSAYAVGEATDVDGNPIGTLHFWQSTNLLEHQRAR